MKAAYIEEFGNVESLQTGTMEVPDLGEGDVLVRVESAGVNPVDAAVVNGHLQEAFPHEFPLIPGWDLAGVIEDRGFSSRRFEIGDKVYGYARRPLVKWGTFAEYVVIPESYLARRPKGLTGDKAGAIPLAGLTAYQSLYKAGELQEGQTVLILGASGGVGSMAIQLAVARGARVMGVASSENHDYMRKLGADETIDYSKADVGDAAAEYAAGGVDLIFDCAGGETLQQSLSALKEGGRLVSILNRGDDLDPGIDHEYVFVEPNSIQLERLAEMAENGQLKVHISRRYSLNEAAEALSQIQSLHTTGKIVITPQA